jgi:hypothetical protein
VGGTPGSRCSTSRAKSTPACAHAGQAGRQAGEYHVCEGGCGAWRRRQSTAAAAAAAVAINRQGRPAGAEARWVVGPYACTDAHRGTVKLARAHGQ